MKKIILSACVMFITIAAYGQRDKGTVTLQPKVGLNMATITNDNDACRVNQQVQNYKTCLKNSRFGVEKFNFSLGLSFNFFCIDIILLSV